MATGVKRETMADLIAEHFANQQVRITADNADGIRATADRLLYALKAVGSMRAPAPPGSPHVGAGGLSVFRYEERAIGPYAGFRTPAIVWADGPDPEGYPLAADVPAPD